LEATIEDINVPLSESLQSGRISKILVPIDGSICSRKAVEFAVDLATKYNSEICLVHVIPPFSVWNYCLMTVDGGFVPVCTIGEIEKTGERLLLTTLASVKEAGVKAYAQLDHGYPANKIVQIAEEEKIDLIVIGSNDLSFIARLLFGSVSDKVFHKAPCPVLVVKGSQEKK